MIDLKINEAKIQQNAKHCKLHKIKLPTFGQMQNPETIADEIKDELKKISLWGSFRSATCYTDFRSISTQKV